MQESISNFSEKISVFLDNIYRSICFFTDWQYLKLEMDL